MFRKLSLLKHLIPSFHRPNPLLLNLKNPLFSSSFKTTTAIFPSISSKQFSSFQKSSSYNNNYQEDLSLLTETVSTDDVIRYQAAIEKYTTSKNLNDDETYDILDLLQKIALAYNSVGGVEKAESYLLEASDFSKGLEMKFPLEIVSINYMLANLYLEKEDLFAAENHLAQVKQVCKEAEVSSELENFNVQALELLGRVYVKQDKFEEALQEFNKALEQIDKVSEEDRSNFLTSIYQEMAMIYTCNRDFEKALEYWKKGLDLTIETYGEGDHMMEFYYSNIANILLEMKEATAAQFYANKALESARNSYEEESLEIAWNQQLLGKIYQMTGEGDKALESYLEVAQIFSKEPEQYPNELTSAYLEIIKLYNIKGKEQEAHEVFNRGLKALSKAIGEISGSVGELYMGYASVLKEQKEKEGQAEELYRKALSLYEDLEPRNKITISDIHYELGALTFNRGDLEGALKHYKECEKLSFEASKDPLRYEILYNLLGEIYLKLKDYEESVNYFQKVLDLCEAQDPTTKAYLGTHYINLGRVYEEKGMFKNALEAYEKSLEIHETRFGPTHSNTEMSKTYIQDISKKINT